MCRFTCPSVLIASLIPFATLALAPAANANNTVRNAWLDRYSSVSSSYTNLSLGCTLCHATSGGQNWNAYGWSIREQIHSGVSAAQAIVNVEAMNAEGVSGANLEEILASAQPGWRAGPSNTYYFPTSILSNQMPAALTAGTYDLPLPPCPADVTGDQMVNVNDLLVVINAWGACPSPCDACVADIVPDCSVNVSDLIAMINNWGACP